MTIFPTHKTKLKTKLPRHEVLKRLVHNDFYVSGFDYKLYKINCDYILKPVRHQFGPRNSGAPVIKINITPQADGTKLNLSFRPITAVSIIFFIWLLLDFVMQVAFIATTVGEVSLNLVHFLPTLMGLVAYLVGLIIFSLEVISIRKQIKKALEAEIPEVTDEKNQNFKNGMKRKDNNKFIPYAYAIVSFAYLLIAGIVNYFVNPEEKLWLNLAFVLPMVIYSLFTLFIHKAKIKNVKASDIYLPAIVYLAVDLICSYGFVLIYPDMFLTKAYWANLWIFILTAICIVILTVITKIPRKRFVILSYIGVLILVFYAITSAVMLCISKIKVTPGTVLDILLLIRENIIN